MQTLTPKNDYNQWEEKLWSEALLENGKTAVWILCTWTEKSFFTRAHNSSCEKKLEYFRKSSAQTRSKMGKFARKVQEKSDKYIPIVLNSLTIIFCMCTFIPIGSVKNYFHGECVLYAQPVLTAVTRPNNLTTITVDLKSSVWGELSTCYYVIYTPVVVGIYTFIWLWFHIQLRMSIFDEG